MQQSAESLAVSSSRVFFSCTYPPCLQLLLPQGSPQLGVIKPVRFGLLWDNSDGQCSLEISVLGWSALCGLPVIWLRPLPDGASSLVLSHMSIPNKHLVLQTPSQRLLLENPGCGTVLMASSFTTLFISDWLNSLHIPSLAVYLVRGSFAYDTCSGGNTNHHL